MESIVKIAGLCLTVSVLSSLLKRDSPEIALLLSVAAVVVGGSLALRAVGDVLALGRELAALTGLPATLFLPLLKTAAVALISRIGSALCLDAGQSALARVLDTTGAFCALCCATPLLRAVTELLEAWL